MPAALSSRAAKSSFTGREATVQRLLLQLPHWRELTHPGSHKVLSVLERCHTAAMGYHAYRCTDSGCGAMHYQYHACRNRHCPACGGSKREAWIEARMKELLPVSYYHVVFTLPHKLNALVLGNRKAMFDLLFQAASYTLLTFARDEQYLGASPGIIAVLHTWGQTLSFHPHLHCIVSGGGIGKDGRWQEAHKAKHRYLFPEKAMAVVYRAYFLRHLQRLIDKGGVRLSDEQHRQWPLLRGSLYNTEWITYCKAPFGGPGQSLSRPSGMVEYLGRYTHKVAISNHRITKIDEQSRVTFCYKDYSDAGKQKEMTLSGEEFLRRFEQHLLPLRFQKIRHYGYLSNRGRKERITTVLNQLQLPPHPEAREASFVIRLIEQQGHQELLCPVCKKATLELLYVCDSRATRKEVLRE